MGAFDCELAALGYDGGKTRGGDFIASSRYIEPELGARVVASRPGENPVGTVVYCSEETVVVRFDKPYKGKWRKEIERSYYRPNTHFYPAQPPQEGA